MAQGKLSKKLINLYGLPDLGFALFINVELYFFAAYLTDYAKFPIAVAGTILTAFAAVDLVWVFLTGIIIQKCNLKWGKYRSWFLIGPPAVVVFFTLMFSKIGPMTVAAVLIFLSAIIKTLAEDLAYASHAGQLSAISNDPSERALLAARRSQYSAAGTIIFAALGMNVITLFGKLTNEMMGYTLGAFFWALICAICYFVLFKLTEGVEKPENVAAQQSADTEKLSIVQMFKAVIKNPPLLVMLLADTARNLGMFLILATAFYYFRVVLDNLAVMSIYLLCYNIASFLGTFMTNFLVEKIGKKKAYAYTLICCAACLIIAWKIGTTPVAFIVPMTLAAFFLAPAAPLVMAMASDTVVYSEWKHGEAARGFIMSMINVPIKVGAMLRSTILAAGLAAAGYVADAVPTAKVIAGVSKLMTLWPCLIILAGAIILLIGYQLSESKVIEMTKEIEARKSVATA